MRDDLPALVWQHFTMNSEHTSGDDRLSSFGPYLQEDMGRSEMMAIVLQDNVIYRKNYTFSSFRVWC